MFVRMSLLCSFMIVTLTGVDIAAHTDIWQPKIVSPPSTVGYPLLPAQVTLHPASPKALFDDGESVVVDWSI